MIRGIILSATLLMLPHKLAVDDALTLWFDKPAAKAMDEALPLGNGRLGAMIFGIPQAERIVLNEDSLWTGNDNPSGEYKDDFGAYQVLGELRFLLLGHRDVTNYRRNLDLTNAVASVQYESEGV